MSIFFCTCFHSSNLYEIKLYLAFLYERDCLVRNKILEVEELSHLLVLIKNDFF